MREALPVAEELLQGRPRSAGAGRRLAVVCSTLASLEDDEDPPQAISHWRCASELLEQICATPPASISDRASLADPFLPRQTIRLERDGMSPAFSGIVPPCQGLVLLSILLPGVALGWFVLAPSGHQSNIDLRRQSVCAESG